MDSLVRRCILAVVTMALGLNLAGCFPSRRGVYSDLHRARLESFTRWRDGIDKDDVLPRVEGKLTVEDAVRLGLDYNPALQSILQEQRKAAGRTLTAYGEALPTVDLSAGYTRLDQITTIDLGATTFAVGDRDNYSYELSITQPLFKGGSIPTAIRAAKFYEFFNDERVRQAVQETILQVARSYYDVLLAEHLYRVQEEALEFAEANLRDVMARERAGIAIPFDRLRAEVEVSNVQADLIQQRNQLNRMRTTLFRAAGISQKSDVTLVDELAYAPVEPDPEQAVMKAFTNRPELFQGELNVLLRQAALRVAYSDYLPELEAWSWHQWAKPDPHESSNIDWDRQWMAGVRLTWSLFDGLRREGNVIQQRAALRQSAINLADTEQLVLEEVRNAILDLRDADELVKSQELNLQQADEALRLVILGAREGVNTELEVLDARSALTRARGLHYRAMHAHVMARLVLQRAMGMLTTPPGAAEVPERPPTPGVMESFMGPGDEEAPVEQGGQTGQQVPADAGSAATAGE